VQQTSFFDQQGIAVIRQLGGASGTVLFDWFDNGYYAAKAYSAQKPYTLISEWLCADIASQLGLPVPARRIIPWKGANWLGFEWRGDPKGYSPGMETKLVNPECIAGMMAFDVLVCNRDRHGQNMVFQHPSPGSDRYICNLIDHSHSLIGDFPNFQGLLQFLQNCDDPTAFLQAIPAPLRQLVQNSTRPFDLWLQKIEALTRRELEDSSARLPLEWKPTPDDMVQLMDFLFGRKDKVRALLMAGLSTT